MLSYMVLLCVATFYAACCVTAATTVRPTAVDATTILSRIEQIRKNFKLTELVNKPLKTWISEYLRFPQTIQEWNKTGTVIPGYWKHAHRLGQNLSAIRYLYWHTYAFCNHYYRWDTPENCTGYLELFGEAYVPLFRTTVQGGGPNRYDSNPLRCHLIKGVLDLWAQKPYFVYHWRKIRPAMRVKSYNATAA